jgi:hypothetical protein
MGGNVWDTHTWDGANNLLRARRGRMPEGVKWKNKEIMITKLWGVGW